MDASKLLWSIVAFLSLGTYNSTVAQQINAPQLGMTGQVGQGAVGAPNVVERNGFAVGGGSIA